MLLLKKNSNYKPKLKAFTLMELATGMLLTTITAAAGFSLYLYFLKSIQNHQNEDKIIKNMQTCYFTIQNDLQNSENIIPIDNGFLLEKYSGENVKFILEDTLLIRISGEQISDTFMIYTYDLKIPEEEIYFGRVRKISFVQKLLKQELTWHWKKEYSIAEEINHFVKTEHGH